MDIEAIDCYGSGVGYGFGDGAKKVVDSGVAREY